MGLMLLKIGDRYINQDYIKDIDVDAITEYGPHGVRITMKDGGRYEWFGPKAIQLREWIQKLYSGNSLDFDDDDALKKVKAETK